MQSGQHAFRHVEGCKHLAGPAAAGNVQQQRAGGVGYIHRALAGEPKAHVILGKQEGAKLPPQCRLVVPHPEQFGEREVGEGGIRGEGNEAVCAELFGKPCGFWGSSLIAPDERRTENAIVLIQQNGTVHLTAQADGSDPLRCG